MREIMNKWIADMVKQGISNAHIESMQSRFLQSSDAYHLYYDEVDNLEQTLENVDVSKIGGIQTGWSTAGRSVYELFFSVTKELVMEEPPLHWRRILDNLNSLRTNGLLSQHQFYANATIEHYLRDGLPAFDHYVEDDIYFSNATHRTVSAIMFNAPHMVGYVTAYRKNEIKFRNYLLHMETKKNWEQFVRLELKNIIINEIDNDHQEYQVYCKESKQTFLFSFTNPLLKETNENLIQTEMYRAEEMHVNELIDKIKEIDKRLITMNVSKLPLLLRLARKNKLLYRRLAIFYTRSGVYIDIQKDATNTVMRKMKVLLRKSIIPKHIPRD